MSEIHEILTKNATRDIEVSSVGNADIVAPGAIPNAVIEGESIGSMESVKDALYETCGELNSFISEYGDGSQTRTVDPTILPEAALVDDRTLAPVGIYETSTGSDPIKETVKSKLMRLDADLRELEEIIFPSTNSQNAVDPNQMKAFSDYYGISEEEAKRMIRHLRSSLDEIQNNKLYQMMFDDFVPSPNEPRSSQERYREEVKKILETIKQQPETQNKENITLDQLIEMEKRVASIESSLGNLSHRDIDGRILFSDIGSAIKEVAMRMIILEDERMGVLTHRLKVLTKSLDRVQETTDQLPFDKSHYSVLATQINALYDTATKADMNNGVLRQVVERLRDLKIVHLRSSTLHSDMETLATHVTALKSQVDLLKDASERLESHLESAIEKVEATI